MSSMPGQTESVRIEFRLKERDHRLARCAPLLTSAPPWLPGGQGVEGRGGKGGGLTEEGSQVGGELLCVR